jgi:hypothetical protein
MMVAGSPSAHPELVEGLLLSCRKEGQGFDKLSLSGF